MTIPSKWLPVELDMVGLVVAVVGTCFVVVLGHRLRSGVAAYNFVGSVSGLYYV